MGLAKKNHDLIWMKYLPLVTQLGFSIVLPPILCLWLASFLQKRFGLGGWVTLVAILVGIAASVGSMINFFKLAIRHAKEKKEGDD